MRPYSPSLPHRLNTDHAIDIEINYQFLLDANGQNLNQLAVEEVVPISLVRSIQWHCAPTVRIYDASLDV